MSDPTRPRFDFPAALEASAPRINATVPKGYVHLRDFLASRREDGRTLAEQVRDQDHPVRIELQSGAMPAKLFDTATGRLTDIDPQLWHGAMLWSSLEAGVLVQAGTQYWVLVGAATLAPFQKLLHVIDTTLPDFPPRLRRLIELYYELELGADLRSIPATAQILIGKKWDPDSAADTIKKGHIETLYRVLQRPQTASGAERYTRGPKKSPARKSP